METRQMFCDGDRVKFGIVRSAEKLGLKVTFYYRTLIKSTITLISSYFVKLDNTDVQLTKSMIDKHSVSSIIYSTYAMTIVNKFQSRDLLASWYLRYRYSVLTSMLFKRQLFCCFLELSPLRLLRDFLDIFGFSFLDVSLASRIFAACSRNPPSTHTTSKIVSV